MNKISVNALSDVFFYLRHGSPEEDIMGELYYSQIYGLLKRHFILDERIYQFAAKRTYYNDPTD